MTDRDALRRAERPEQVEMHPNRVHAHFNGDSQHAIRAMQAPDTSSAHLPGLSIDTNPGGTPSEQATASQPSFRAAFDRVHERADRRDSDGFHALSRAEIDLALRAPNLSDLDRQSLLMLRDNFHALANDQNLHEIIQTAAHLVGLPTQISRGDAQAMDDALALIHRQERLGAAHNPEAEAATQVFNRRFNEWDTNHDHKLSHQEMTQAAQTEGLSQQERQALQWAQRTMWFDMNETDPLMHVLDSVDSQHQVKLLINDINAVSEFDHTQARRAQ